MKTWTPREMKESLDKNVKGGRWRWRGVNFLTKISAMLSCIRISVGQLEAWPRLRLSRDLLCWDWKRKIHISEWWGEGEEIKQATRQHLTRITCHSGKLCGKLCSCGSPFALINFSVTVARAKTSPEQPRAGQTKRVTAHYFCRFLQLLLC